MVLHRQQRGSLGELRDPALCLATIVTTLLFPPAATYTYTTATLIVSTAAVAAASAAATFTAVLDGDGARAARPEYTLPRAQSGHHPAQRVRGRRSRPRAHMGHAGQLE